MRICYSKVEVLPDQGLLKNIEVAGRVCYKSEDKITETSAAAFVDMIRRREHYSVLEHGSIYLKVPKDYPIPFIEMPWCHIEVKDNFKYIYTNLRYVVEVQPELADAILAGDPLPQEVEFFTPDINDPYKRFSVRIITNFKISEQYVRHRVFSHSKESSRYCNYSKQKFNSELTFIIPQHFATYFNYLEGKIEGIDDKWYFTPGSTYEDAVIQEEALRRLYNMWPHEGDKTVINVLDEASSLHKLLSRCKLAELDYLEDIAEGFKPEEARDYLTLFAKTEQVMTGFLKDWEDMLIKRRSAPAQSEARFIANNIHLKLHKLTNKSDKKTSDYDKLSLDDLGDNMVELMRRVGINRVRLDD